MTGQHLPGTPTGLTIDLATASLTARATRFGVKVARFAARVRPW